jgi:hypothetical protein
MSAKTMYKCGHDFDRRDGCRTCAAGLQAQRDALLAAAKLAELQGCMCHDTADQNWHSKRCPMTALRAAIAATESKEKVSA